MTNQQSLNWTIAALAYDLPEHDIEDVVDWRGEGDEVRPYADRIDDIVAVATLLDPMLVQYGPKGDESIDSYGTIDRVVERMVTNYKNTRSYRMSPLEVRACLDWHDPERRRIVDPNATLNDIRSLVRSIQDGSLKTPGNIMRAGVELAEKLQNLDQWIVTGGFLPADWRDKTTPTS